MVSEQGRQRWAQYGAALVLVAVGFGARCGLQPVFGANHAYTIFYPVVLIAAYAFGVGPACVVAVISGALGYWFFATPIYALKFDADNLTLLGIFALTSSSTIYLMGGMSRAVAETKVAQAQAERLAQAHAALFRELNERVTNHLQLVAALLQLQARDEPDAAARKALGEASARTMLISKTHRVIAGEGGELLDLGAFARQLLDATLSARSHPPVRVEFEQGGLWLSSEQATSVAIVLLECLNARLSSDDPGLMRIGLRADRGLGRLRITEIEKALDPIAPTGPSLIDAMVEQLRGRFSSRSAAEGRVSELTFPLEYGHGGQGLPAPTLH